MSYIDLDKWFNEANIYDYHIIKEQYFIGKYDVLYGVRLRGGKIKSWYFEIDICCARASRLLDSTLEYYKWKMELNLDADADVFEGLLPVSNVRPIFNDIEFMKFLIESGAI